MLTPTTTVTIEDHVYQTALDYIQRCSMEGVSINKSRLDHCQWIIESVAKGVLHIEVEGEFVDE